MNVSLSKISGVKLISLPCYQDSRGGFTPLYAERLHKENGIPSQWAETNLSVTEEGVIRGLHYQDPEPQAKLITVISGEIFDVVVDLRAESKSYGEWASFELSAENPDLPNQIFLPEGLAHGFATPKGSASVVYQVSRPWNQDFEKVIRWDDGKYNISWPIKNPILSERDRNV